MRKIQNNFIDISDLFEENSNKFFMYILDFQQEELFSNITDTLIEKKIIFPEKKIVLDGSSEELWEFLYSLDNKFIESDVFFILNKMDRIFSSELVLNPIMSNITPIVYDGYGENKNRIIELIEKTIGKDYTYFNLSQTEELSDFFVKKTEEIISILKLENIKPTVLIENFKNKFAAKAISDTLSEEFSFRTIIPTWTQDRLKFKHFNTKILNESWYERYDNDFCSSFSETDSKIKELLENFSPKRISGVLNELEILKRISETEKNNTFLCVITKK